MADKTHIEWTDATWNPVTGCTKVSPGCDHCYAETIAHRFAGTAAYPNGFGVTLRPERLDLPLRWKRPRRVFVNSMSDLFHADIPDEYIARVFAVMALAPQHTFQVLTKRHARMRSLLSSADFRLAVEHEATRRKQQEWAARGYPKGRKAEDRTRWEYPDWPLPNVWLGVSVEDQKWADIRIPALLDTPAAVRFLSCEPLLGPIQLAADEPRFGGGGRAGYRSGGAGQSFFPGLDWVIVGGESGPGARPMHPDWARSLRDQCAKAGVPFLFKQWGEWGPAPWKLARLIGETTEDYIARSNAEAATHSLPVWAHQYGMAPQPAHPAFGSERARDIDGGHAALRRWGKRAAGRELDGRTWDEYPAGTS